MKHWASQLLRCCKKGTQLSKKKNKNAKETFFDSDVATVIYPALKLEVLCQNATSEWKL